MIQDKDRRKRKCTSSELEPEQVPESNDSSDFNTSSFIRNSREKSYIDEANIQPHGSKRQRYVKKK
jgi:hypothetical protein